MKIELPGIMEHSRETTGEYASLAGSGPNGRFRIFIDGVFFLVLASTGAGWEHVSVSLPNKKRCPTWEEMCTIKDLFWDSEEVVVQYHPARSKYVNCHPYVLHLWKPTGLDLPAPASILVGPRLKHGGK
jgi:hypothetical protein